MKRLRSERQSRGHDNGSNGGSHIQTVRADRVSAWRADCRFGYQWHWIGANGRITSAPSRIDEAGERPPWQPRIAGQSVEPVDKLNDGGCSCEMWSPYVVRFKTLAAIDYHIIEKFTKTVSGQDFSCKIRRAPFRTTTPIMRPITRSG